MPNPKRFDRLKKRRELSSERAKRRQSQSERSKLKATAKVAKRGLKSWTQEADTGRHTKKNTGSSRRLGQARANIEHITKRGVQGFADNQAFTEKREKESQARSKARRKRSAKKKKAAKKAITRSTLKGGAKAFMDTMRSK